MGKLAAEGARAGWVWEENPVLRYERSKRTINSSTGREGGGRREGRGAALAAR